MTPEQPEVVVEPRSHRRGLFGKSLVGTIGWFLSLAMVGAMFGAVIIGLMRFVNGPVESGPVTLAGLQAKASPTPYKAPTNTLTGTYAQFDYPGMFDSVTQIKQDPQALEQYNLSSKESYRRTITMSVRPLQGTLHDDSSYRFREQTTLDYKAVKVKLGSEDGVVMERLDNQEATLFWLHNGKLLIVAITSTDPSDHVATMMDVVTKSARWRG